VQPVAAEARGPAALDRRHDFELPKAQMAAVSRPVLRTSRTEDVGDLKRRSSHARWAAQPPKRLRRRFAMSLSVSYRGVSDRAGF
jgi:hypothetical protein